MAVTFVFRQFPSWTFLVQIRSFATFAMSTGIRPHARWVPSELNPADAPSRNWFANIKSQVSTGQQLEFQRPFQVEVEAREKNIGLRWADKNTV